MVHQVHEPTGRVISKATKSLPICLAVTGLGKEFTLHRLRQSPRELLDLHSKKDQSSSQC